METSWTTKSGLFSWTLIAKLTLNAKEVNPKPHESINPTGPKPLFQQELQATLTCLMFAICDA